MEFIDIKKQYKVLKDAINQRINRVLDNADFILGEDVSLLENELEDFTGTKHCITCANGTDALTLALKTLDIGKNDAVFVPTFTFFASAEVVTQVGATAIFVDVDYDTFNICTDSLQSSIEYVLEKTELIPKCVIAVDLFGQCANYVEIAQIAKKYNLFIIEDAAQGFGGSIKGKFACSFGDIATTSFFPAKPLGCYGDGGAIFTNNKAYSDVLKSLRFHGRGNDKYDNIRLGYNSRLDTLQAAILRAKLKAFREYELFRRQEIAEFYNSELRQIVSVPTLLNGYTSSFAQYTIKLEDKEDRNSLQQHLKNHGIPSMVYYPRCMHQQTAYKGYPYKNESFKNAEKLVNTVLSLPMHAYLEDEDLLKIVKGIKSFYNLK